MSKFKALKEIIEGVAPTVAKEGEEAAASALAKEAEEAAAREAFKSEFSPETWYHGTPKGGFTSFDTVGSNYGLFGQGSYFTDNPEIASSYTKKGLKQLLSKGQTPSQTVYPVKLRMKNPIVMEEAPDIEEWKKAAGDFAQTIEENKNALKTNEDVYRLLEQEIGDYGAEMYEGAEWMQNILRKKGHDSIRHIGGGRVGNGPKHNVGIVFDSNQVRTPWARFDPKKRNSGNTMDSIVAATTGAGAYSALSPESAEASEIKEKPKSQLKDLLKDYSPSFGSKTGDYSSYDESEALPTEGMQGQGLATIIRNIIADKKPKGEFEEGGGGIEESAISPIDFITPGMVTTPAKALGRGALTAGKAGLEAVESGAQALAKRYPELAKRLADNRGSIDLSKKASEYMVPGPWQESRYKRITEELPIEFLEKYKGNALGKTDIEALKKSIQEEGLKEPLILSFDPDTKRIKLGEGNHRLEALRQLGYTHAPVRASRSYVEDPRFPQVLIKPSTDRIDPSYYPADIKPSDIIDFEKLLKSKK